MINEGKINIANEKTVSDIEKIKNNVCELMKKMSENIHYENAEQLKERLGKNEIDFSSLKEYLDHLAEKNHDIGYGACASFIKQITTLGQERMPVKELSEILTFSNAKKCKDIIRGEEKNRFNDIMVSRMVSNEELFSATNEEERKELKSQLIKMIAFELVQSNVNDGMKIFTELTSLSDSDQKRLDDFLANGEPESKTDKNYLDIAQKKEKLINLHLLSEEDRPEIIKEVFKQFEAKSRQQGYDDYSNLQFMLSSKYNRFYADDIEAHFKEIIEKTFDKIRNNTIADVILENRIEYLGKILKNLAVLHDDENAKSILDLLKNGIGMMEEKLKEIKAKEQTA